MYSTILQYFMYTTILQYFMYNSFMTVYTTVYFPVCFSRNRFDVPIKTKEVSCVTVHHIVAIHL
jgi:hypothetical protein